MEVWAIIVAAGSGSRFGRLKQLDPLGSRRVLDWAIDAMDCPDRTVVVVPNDQLDLVGLSRMVVVAGGATRSASVRSGLDALPMSATHVLIHDGARPLTPASVVLRVVEALASADGAIPVIPVTDTLRKTDGTLVNRENLVAVQTPQGFSVPALMQAHADLPEATDDAALVANVGGNVVHVDGDQCNLKITVPIDLVVAEALLRQGADL